MKRILLTSFLCIFSIIAYAQEDEFYALLAQESQIAEFMVYKDPNFSGQRYETRYVRVENKGGYKFHIADYPGGNRVVTCLDGNMKGYQGISYNGVQFAESFTMESHKKYFVHFYIDGEIQTYENKQIAKFN